MAFASTANAGITIPAGDWTLDIGGNVNAYYTNTRFGGDLANARVSGQAGKANSNNISTGLLPSAIGIGGKTRQNDLDVAFQFTFFTSVDSNGNGGGGAGVNSYNDNGAGGGALNIRQAFMTFGDASWGQIKAGKDLGVFGSDAILSDMTLLGVGTAAGGNGSSTLGRIGSGYHYADWLGQIQYTSPNWNGFAFTVAARQPWANSDNNNIGFDGKVTYDFTGDVSGRVWAGMLHQRTQTAGLAARAGVAGVLENGTGNGVTGVAARAETRGQDDTARAWELGAKASFSGIGLVGYYYQGQNLGSSAIASANLPLTGLLVSTAGQNVKGGYAQATYALPGYGTKLGVSYGLTEQEGRANAADMQNKSWIVGAYHPLTKSLNLVAEYTDARYENVSNVRGQDGTAKTMSLGAILFF
jgi:predicted porin